MKVEAYALPLTLARPISETDRRPQREGSDSCPGLRAPGHDLGLVDHKSNSCTARMVTKDGKEDTIVSAFSDDIFGSALVWCATTSGHASSEGGAAGGIAGARTFSAVSHYLQQLRVQAVRVKVAVVAAHVSRGVAPVTPSGATMHAAASRGSLGNDCVRRLAGGAEEQPLDQGNSGEHHHAGHADDLPLDGGK